MAGPNDPENKAAKKPAVPVKKAAPTKPRVVNDAKQTAIDPAGTHIGTYADPANYPGLLTNENVGTYRLWLGSLPTKHADQWTLIQQHGPKLQAMLWRAFRDAQDPNDVLNMIASEFPGSTTITSGGGSRGGGGGGGGGGGTAAPTPEQIASAKAEITNRSAILGHIPLTDDVLTWVATTIVRDNWTSAQLDDWLLAKPEDINKPGLVDVSVDQIRQLAGNQLLAVSDATAREWAMKINSGEMDINTVQSIFANQALQEFGWASDGIKAGLNVKDMLAPQRDRIAQELEIGGDQVDLMDPKWRNMVTVTDATSGMPRAATLTEVARNARQDPLYRNTAGAASNGGGIFAILRHNFEGT